MLKKDRKGISLIDILVSLFILTLSGAALLSLLLSALYFIDLSREQSIAVSDLRNMMESVRATPFSNMPANFPNNTQDGPSSRRYYTLIGGYNLRSEHITVTYANTLSDPLEVKVTLSWQNKYGRLMSSSMSTFKAR